MSDERLSVLGVADNQENHQGLFCSINVDFEEAEMSKTPDGGPAFPMPAGPEPRVNEATHYNEGMTLRDYFAAKVMQAEIALWTEGSWMQSSNHIAKKAYIMADAMLEVREK